MTREFSTCRQHWVGDAAAAAAVLHPCAEVGVLVGCSAPPRTARGLARDCRRDESTVGISPGLPFDDTDPHARGYGCARGLGWARHREGSVRLSSHETGRARREEGAPASGVWFAGR